MHTELNLRKNDSKLWAQSWNKRSTPIKYSNLQDKRFASFKEKSEDIGENAKRLESSTKKFESLSANLKQKVEKWKGFESPQGGSESII